MSEQNTLTSRELGFLLRQKQFNWYIIYTNVIQVAKKIKGSTNTRFPLLRFRSALHCGYSGITDIQDGLFFVLTRATTFKKARVRCAIANSKIFAKTFTIFYSRPLSLSVRPLSLSVIPL